MYRISRHMLLSACGRPCPDCGRIMVADDRDLRPTRDHFPIPKSKRGGRVRVCCSKCNGIKGDMSAEDWAAFKLANPGWWLKETGRSLKRERGARAIRQPEKPSTPMADALVHHRMLVEAHHRARNEARPKKENPA